MKYFLSIFLFSIFLSGGLLAQSDTLTIKLKNGTTEKIACSQIKSIRFENLVGVEDQIYQQEQLTVKGNFPNPFNQQTTFEFDVDESGFADITIFDNLGNIINKMISQPCKQGTNLIIWNSADKSGNLLESGVYYYEVRYKDIIKIKKMLIIK